jgi:hypothetical protein
MPPSNFFVSDEIADSFMPYLTQHEILNRVQNSLEHCCFDFASANVPSLLDGNNWLHPVAVELTEWMRIFLEVTDTLEPRFWAKFHIHFRAVRDLRNVAVHRTPITRTRLYRYLCSAEEVARLLENSENVKLFRHIRRQLIDEMALQVNELDKEKTAALNERIVAQRGESLLADGNTGLTS